MPIYYHVDRLGQLTPGLDFQFQKMPIGQWSDLVDHAELHWPQGVSRHGNQYLGTSVMNSLAVAIEIAWEFLRRGQFPERPSRFASVFAWKTYAEANAFRQKAAPQAKIWAIEAQEGFTANMTLLTIGHTALRISQLADAYWQGKAAPEEYSDQLAPPCWEVLVPLPVQVLYEATQE